MAVSAARSTEGTAPAPAATAVAIAAEGVCLTYGAPGSPEILRDVSLSVPRGGFVSLIGPSGCGKSTLLKIMAGLVEPTTGRMTVAGIRPVEAAKRRKIGLVFQDANLLPWKSALDNAMLLRSVADKAMPKAEVRARAEAMLELVGLADAMRKLPSQMSGGMRQRAAIARALALDPDVLLMDEPFGALDAITRDEMCEQLLDIWQRTHKTIVLVTHSIDEAVFLSGEVHVLGVKPGRIVETIDIPFAYPRGEATHEDARFRALENHLRGLLRRGHGGRQ